jgi:uncharacterized membrane protein YphA (DoxX/SURF4 family)
MNVWTRIFLVLLRLAIGWHFLFEGWEKIYSVDIIGETTTNRPFTSAGYLNEASGPFADFFRNQVRESDDEFLQRLTLVPLSPGQDSVKVPPVSRFPPSLVKEWQEYFDHFSQYYQLDPQQAKLAEGKLRQREDNTATWLLSGKKKAQKVFPKGTIEVEETTAQRVQDYRDKLLEVRDMETKVLGAFEKDVLKEKLRLAKAELSKMRKELQDDLRDQLAETDKALQDVLSLKQKEDAPTPELKKPPKALWIDRVTRYGLTAIGACLLLGFWTRTACVGGAGFLLLLYLAMPPFPWLPEPTRTEGHYLFVNKNVIEMLALLALATTRSGRWAGLDGLLYLLNPFRRRRQPRQDLGNDQDAIYAESEAYLHGKKAVGQASTSAPIHPIRRE